MPAWTQQLLVVLLMAAALALLVRRLIGHFRNKNCGCDHCPTKDKSINP